MKVTSDRKIVFIFGNPDLEIDSLPVKMMPKLRQTFPDISFEIKDPNEEWDVPEELTVIDTVMGLDEVTVFNDLESFDSSPRLTMHDFDALANLKYLKKLGKLKRIKIIGVPMDIKIDMAFESIVKQLR
jgi:hypothetical protein